MQMFYNAATRTKLLISFLFIILINAAILTVSVSSINYARNASAEVDVILNGAFGRIFRISKAVNMTQNNVLLGLNDDYAAYLMDDLQRDLPGMLREIESSVAVINPDFFGANSEYSAACNTMISNARNGLQMLEKHVVPLIQQGKKTEASAKFIEHVLPYFRTSLEATYTLFSIQARKSLALTGPSADPTPVYTSLTLGIIGTVIAIFLALFISGYISKSIEHQGRIIKRMSEGDFAFHIESGYKDEFGMSHNMLRDMRNKLNEIIISTKDACHTLQEEMRHLQHVSQTIVESSGNVETQAVSVSAASDEMVSTTSDIARNCETAAASSQICKDISDNGLHQVIGAVSMIRNQSEQTKLNACKIESLAQQTNNIGSIVSTIDDIAAQTNLLALNAAIEAARAGEAGRGFAVVADEVRALASRTTASTQEISKMVKNIQDEAAAATAQINASVNDMVTVAETAGQTEELLKDITQHVIDVNNQIAQIATAAEEQTTATSEISMNMQHITAATEQMADDANKQGEAMDKAYNELEKLIRALEFFRTRD